MPESRESQATFEIVDAALTTLIQEGVSLRVENIEIDATKKEQKRFPKSHPAKSGLPYAIDSKCTVKRGINEAQGYVYPDMWRTSGKKRSEHSLTELVLKGILYTHRALILDFGALFLMIQWITHTSAHLYPREDYESTVKLVHKRVRKFKVGMAFVFKTHVLAFNSNDLVFQPTWAISRDKLPPSPADIYSPDWVFLSTLAEWLQSRCGGESDRNGLACDVIRDASNVFLGVGVYTVIEIFFLAGLSPLLTEEEVFSNPSRTARFCAGYLQFQDRSLKGLSGLIRPAMCSGYLAPTTRQRLKYIDWLHVYAKDCSRIPVRMADLVDDYITQLEQRSEASTWIRYETDALYDVFEPTLVSAALSLPHNLGHLIYGAEVWAELGGVVSNGQDALTKFFREQGALHSPMFLRPGHYVPLFLERADISSQSLPRRHIYTYRHTKQMWSITPFPENSQGLAHTKDAAYSYQIEGEARQRMLFSYIVEKTHNVAIGPLEYCSTAHRVRIGSSTVVSPCYGDPSLPEYYAIRDLKGLCLPRRSATSGGRRPGMGASELKKFDEYVGELAKSKARKRAREEQDENENEMVAVPKPKKKRLNADQRLAMAGSQILRPVEN
ncbi:hypothetical protein B0H10DRAFT_2060951 [Mycena sp. CBHHK59/15]|nr:hypothetical protein B0H10DRAFT_2060951 [Mycena sp. CBHHK59/15]